MIKLLALSLFLLSVVSGVKYNARFSETYITMLTHEVRKIDFIISSPLEYENPEVKFIVQFNEILSLSPNATEIYENITSIEIEALKAGETNIFSESSHKEFQNAYFNVKVYKSEFIEILSIIMGWLYFLAWSVSFYPQVYENYKRKSVVGLNFDYLATNLTGYICYSLFNLGLFYIPAIREQYEERYPFSIVSVLPNDIFFSIHAFAVTAYTCLQCFWYDKGEQKISWFGKAFHYISGIILVIAAIMCFTNYMLWLDFLYINSYIKLAVTFSKYGPQAIMNYQRKSTDGWSIGTVLLDVAGGIFCILQMFLNAYNYEKWEWILENPTKLWLGILSLLFDFLFMAQHYCLYNKEKDILKKIPNGTDIKLDLSEKQPLNN